MNANNASAAESGNSSMSWLLTVAGIVVSLLILAALLLPQIAGSRETARGNFCRSNMRACANSLFQYENHNGKLPGYMNVLQRENGKPYVDPDTGAVTPVSWAVMIMPYVEPRQTGPWRNDATAVVEEDSGKGDIGVRPQKNPNERVYIEQFLCPGDQQPAKNGAPISFVVNTGQPDRPAAIAAIRDDREVAEFADDIRFPRNGAMDGTSTGIPRDWSANGMFFDNFSEHPMLKTTTTNRGPMVYATIASVRDPQERTILLTENIDATEYVFRSATHSAENWKRCEVTTGCIWRPGPIDASTKPPTMTPPAESLKINGSIGKGDGMNYDYCRPSSQHPRSVNVAFVGQNVAQLRDVVSYYVFARLMAPNDDLAGGIGDPFSSYPLTDADIWP